MLGAKLLWATLTSHLAAQNKKVVIWPQWQLWTGDIITLHLPVNHDPNFTYFQQNCISQFSKSAPFNERLSWRASSSLPLSFPSLETVISRQSQPPLRVQPVWKYLFSDGHKLWCGELCIISCQPIKTVPGGNSILIHRTQFHVYFQSINKE